MNDLFSAFLLGVVEGITEFLPISSTGHLIFFSELLGFKVQAAKSFEIFIQLGAILSVVYLYFDRIKTFIDFRPNQTEEFRGEVAIIKIGLGCFPAFFVGFLLHDLIKTKLFSIPVVAVALITGGIIMIAIEKRAFISGKIIEIEKISYKKSFLVGVFQMFALCPGVSRAAATILGGMILGFSRKTATEFSFMLSVPVMAVASSYDLYKAWEDLSFSDLPLFIVGFITSFFVAIFAIKFLIKFIETHNFISFGIYRIIAGIVMLVFLVKF